MQYHKLPKITNDSKVFRNYSLRRPLINQRRAEKAVHSVIADRSYSHPSFGRRYSIPGSERAVPCIFKKAFLFSIPDLFTILRISFPFYSLF